MEGHRKCPDSFDEWLDEKIERCHKAYDAGVLGALRDVGQNHLLQMLAFVTMERPKEFTPKNIRKERKAALEAGELPPEPVIVIDEFGNAVEVVPEVETTEDSQEEPDTAEEPEPA